MYLGLDVGGTHTDGVRLNEYFAVIKRAKTPTSADILTGLVKALDMLLNGADRDRPGRLVVSSTLGLNAILSGAADKVGILAGGGPGLRPDLFAPGPLFRSLPAAQNHLGQILETPATADIRAAAESLRRAGAQALAVACKFSVKNPALEHLIIREAGALLGPEVPMTASADFSGLNFPRRLNTAVFNAALTPLFGSFIKALNTAAADRGFRGSIFLLKADGGIMDLDEAARRPVAALAAGPAAGLLGLWSRNRAGDDALMIDVGGTTTDLALLADGQPLEEPQGLAVAGRPTLVRALKSISIPVGGDLPLEWDDEKRLVLGRRRLGPAVALGGPAATLTDALNVLELTRLGDTSASRRALAGLGGPKTAQAALVTALTAIARTAKAFLAEVNSRPVYTVGEMLLDRRVEPRRALVVGGPAEALAESLGRALNLEATAPPDFPLANALGAALARPTLAAELYADTAQGRMSIPALGVNAEVSAAYRLKDAEADILAALGRAAERYPEALAPRIIRAECFNQAGSGHRGQRLIRVQAQTAPGFLS